MPAYIHGNLAVEQKSGQKKVSVKETKKVVYRNKSLPVQEKLLYLFTVLVCVAVASLIIWRYAQIYEMNTKILKLETDIQKLQAENSVLKHKVDGLSSPDRLRQEATKLGMVPPDDKQISKIPRQTTGSPSKETAANQKKTETP
ncbi:cell division protein FtsL [Paenibacillus sp. NPDC056579]|uniref:cell division protein FtsL n=1 Tax=unclassified Paenibacillus TaxID=185978 RepID=UPI001EF90B2D|nr:cell division protein FtsL [Paenibacillus sp. H1-7]ULL17598.1 cell division protein FtsL [Paenibacillus sp. H1-7]